MLTVLTQEVILVEGRQKKLASLNLNGTNQGESQIYPPSCTKPRQPTIYLQALLYLYEVMNVKNV